MNWNENRSKILTNRGKGKKKSRCPTSRPLNRYHLTSKVVSRIVHSLPLSTTPGLWYNALNAYLHHHFNYSLTCDWESDTEWSIDVDFAQVKCRCREWSDGLKPRPHWLHPPPFHISDLTHNNGQVCGKKKSTKWPRWNPYCHPFLD